MEKEGISLKEQELDVRVFREIQEDHNVTNKQRIDEYIMDIEDRIIDVNLQPDYEKAIYEPFEEPQHVVTAAEKEAIDVLSTLGSIESRDVNNQNTATLNATEGLNNLKQGIASKIENLDAEKLDEYWQKFWLMTWSILKGFLDIAAVVATEVYKIPAKRNYKKRLDYTVNEANGRFSGKNIMETAQNDAAYRFKVDWLPKLIITLSAFFIYIEFWKLGWITLGIGLVYYFFTYLNFDYGGSNLLNKLADNMDKQGIRLKDAYFNNMVVLYRYFDEYQSTLGVSIDEIGKIEIYEDKELGSILTFYVNEDKNTTINSITDNKLTYYKVVPFLDKYNDNAKLQNKRQVAIMLDQILLMAINKDEDVSELYAKKEEFWNYFPELKGLADQRQLEAEALLLKLERENVKDEVRKTIKSKGINENAINVILTIYDRKREWKFNVWNVSENAIAGNENYLKIRCIFNQNGNISTVNKLKEELESQFRSQILIKPLQDRGSFDLYILFTAELKEFSLNISELKKYNEQDEIYIGNSLTGPLSSKWNFQANHINVAGGSGAGKSVQITDLLTQLPNLKSFDYKTMFITSSSKMTDFIPFIDNGAAGFEGVEEQEKVFTYLLYMLKEREREFFKSRALNIKEYNKQYPEKAMKQIILVADEWENSRNDMDKKLANRLEGLLVQILNIARSSGCLVIIGSQSILKGDIGTVKDKMFVTYSGTNEQSILKTVDPEIAKYYKVLDKIPQGVFFFSSKNTPAQQENIFFGDTSFTLIQTPFINGLESKNLPKLYGKEFKNEILNGEINEELDEQEVVSYNLNDVVETEETTLNATEKNEDIAKFEL